MDRRLNLGRELEEIAMAATGKSHVYYQPPEKLKIEYPCIVYELSSMASTYADGRPYTFQTKYSITAIDRNPESKFPLLLREMRCVRFDRTFRSDGLYHWVFTITY